MHASAQKRKRSHTCCAARKQNKSENFFLAKHLHKGTQEEEQEQVALTGYTPLGGRRASPSPGRCPESAGTRRAGRACPGEASGTSRAAPVVVEPSPKE